MSVTFGVVDLFAGPGGLGEGFASLADGSYEPFRIGISVENEVSAHRTLTLRAFLRAYKARHGALPRAFIDLHARNLKGVDWATVDAQLWKRACDEAQCLELGSVAAAEILDKRIAAIRRTCDDTVLIGGPPCQAYSLIGRARAKGKSGYVPAEDGRHYLFREYIRALDRLRPAAFVMENVKGMLSSTVESRLVFEMLMEDLASLGTRRGHPYELRAVRLQDDTACLVQPRKPSDFIVRAELFGVPQRRHRVIIVGIRADLLSSSENTFLNIDRTSRTVAGTIGNLPRLRSGISRATDDAASWRIVVGAAAKQLANTHRRYVSTELRDTFTEVAQRIAAPPHLPRSATTKPRKYCHAQDALLRWIERPELSAIAQHETRGHMSSDLGRYLFASAYGKVHGRSPKAEDFPLNLTPEHHNWRSGDFSDRFRVQLAGEPSTTVTSHISKDGHYFIHPDPMQCRSLTVREAARLQTFPDDYLFLGNRTQQYVQVGNAVPPYLARTLASLLHKALTNSAEPPSGRPGSSRAMREMECSGNKGK